MISSMTGFASRTMQTDTCELQWEIRSLNNRSIDIQLHMPENFRSIESECRQIIGECIKRGRIDASLSLTINDSHRAELAIDHQVLAELLNHVNEMRDHVKDLSMPSALDILKWPDVLRRKELRVSELDHYIFELCTQTVQDLHANRQREGSALKELIHEYINELKTFEAQANELLPVASENANQRLIKKINDIEVNVDPIRMEQELALILIKMDVSEEMDRIHYHIGELERVLKNESEVGRKMKFIIQELLREVNTCAAKTTHFEFTTVMVEMKVVLEKLREQINNIA